MKKVVISVVATILVLFFLAQTGLLAPFGIKQLSVFTREKTENDSVEKTGMCFIINTACPGKFSAATDPNRINRTAECMTRFIC